MQHFSWGHLSEHICPYQQYLSCYWPDLDQTLNEGSWEHIFSNAMFSVMWLMAD